MIFVGAPPKTIRSDILAMHTDLADFEIWISAPEAATPGARYSTRVVQSPAGPAVSEFTLEVNDAAFQQELTVVRSIDQCLPPEAPSVRSCSSYSSPVMSNVSGTRARDAWRAGRPGPNGFRFSSAISSTSSMQSAASSSTRRRSMSGTPAASWTMRPAGPCPPREALFFGTRHDPATELSADRLVGPLSTAALPEFRKSVLLADTATKAALVDALPPGGGRHSPAIAFTASHGMGWKAPNPQQPTAQGALICQDWEPFTKPEPSDWLSASDVAADAHVHGLIAFHFACYGAGTPSHDRFMHKRGQPPTEIATQPFLAALPTALLAHPNGSALACIGHVERAWGIRSSRQMPERSYCRFKTRSRGSAPASRSGTQ